MIGVVYQSVNTVSQEMGLLAENILIPGKNTGCEVTISQCMENGLLSYIRGLRLNVSPLF